MKKKILLSVIAVSILSIILIIGCKKELSNPNDPLNNLAQMRWEGLSGIRAENGMLVFDSRESFNRTLEILAREDTSKEYFKEYNSTSTTVYSSGGGDSDVTTTTATVAFGNLVSGVIKVDSTKGDTTVYDPTESIIYDRVLDDFERKFDFKSLRKDIENREIEYLDGGSVGDDPTHHFIANEYLRTVLNPDLEVQIGDTIVRFVNEYRYILIADGDYRTLEEIRKNPLDYNHFPNVLERSVLGEIYWSGYKTDGDCDANFSIYEQPSEIFSFTDHSTSSTTITNYDWNFGDGSPHSLAQNPTHAYTDGATTHTVTLAIYCSSDHCSSSYVYTIYDCWAHFTYTMQDLKVNFNAINFGAPYYFTYAWDFGDGGTASTQDATHLFALPGIKHVCLTVTNNITGCVSDPVCQDITVTAPVIGTCKGTMETWGGAVYANNSNKKFDCKLWVCNNWMVSEVGTKTINYKKKSNGNWAEDKATTLHDQIWGDFYDVDCNNRMNVPLTGAYVDDGTTAKSITTTWGPSHFWSSGVHTIYVHQLGLHSLHYVNSETAVYLNLWQ